MFTTHASGSLECLFSSGYSCLETYSTMLASYYDDAVSWAFCSKTKDQNIANSDDDNGIVYIDGDNIMFDILLMVQNMSSFLQGRKLKHNVGNPDFLCLCLHPHHPHFFSAGNPHHRISQLASGPLLQPLPLPTQCCYFPCFDSSRAWL